MGEEHLRNPEKLDTPKLKWWDLPFDATTNFSLFGWLLERIKERRRVVGKVDLTLED